MLPEILPILSVGLESEDKDKRQGVCIGLSEIMNSTSRDHVIGEKLQHYLPYRMRKYMGFNLGTWLIMVKFTKLNMSEF